MKTEIVFRIRISRAVARSLVTGVILGFPCGTLSPDVVTQTATLSSAVPAAAGQYVQLRTSGKTALGTGGQTVTMTANDTTNCRPSPSAVAEWQQNPTTPCAASLRRVALLGSRQMNVRAYDLNDLSGDFSGSTAKVFVQGDIYANRLCFNDGKCITDWEPEGGVMVAKVSVGVSQCAYPFTACTSPQKLSSTMHLQYSILNTTGSAKCWDLYVGVDRLNSANWGPYELRMTQFTPACTAAQTGTCDIASKLNKNLIPPASPADPSVYHAGNWGPAASQMQYNCGYGYWGTTGIIDCFFTFPKANVYGFYFESRQRTCP